jgi:LacI family transcriptional regulator
MAVRMKDIAKDLGVSIVTVSKVFNNHSDIGAATRERVLRRIKGT